MPLFEFYMNKIIFTSFTSYFFHLKLFDSFILFCLAVFPSF